MDAAPGLATPSRRRLLHHALAPLACAVSALAAFPAAAAVRDRRLDLVHLNTGETLRLTYWAEGGYLRDGLSQANRFFRDWRNGKMHRIDPRLLDLLYGLQRKLATRKPIHIVCGYRSPETNAMLRRQHRGVARNSLHLKGMAVDLRFSERRLSDVRRAAMTLEAGGVGYYPRSNFVHVDTGPVRYW